MSIRSVVVPTSAAPLGAAGCGRGDNWLFDPVDRALELSPLGGGQVGGVAHDHVPVHDDMAEIVLGNLLAEHVSEQLGRVPEIREIVECYGWKIEILAVEETRITRLAAFMDRDPERASDDR